MCTKGARIVTTAHNQEASGHSQCSGWRSYGNESRSTRTLAEARRPTLGTPCSLYALNRRTFPHHSLSGSFFDPKAYSSHVSFHAGRMQFLMRGWTRASCRSLLED